MWLFEAEVPKLYEILLFRWLVLQNLRSGQKSVMIWIHFHCDNQHCCSYLWNVQCTLIPYSDQKTKTGNTITWKCQTSVLDFWFWILECGSKISQFASIPCTGGLIETGDLPFLVFVNSFTIYIALHPMRKYCIGPTERTTDRGLCKVQNELELGQAPFCTLYNFALSIVLNFARLCIFTRLCVLHSFAHLWTNFQSCCI